MYDKKHVNLLLKQTGIHSFSVQISFLCVFVLFSATGCSSGSVLVRAVLSLPGSFGNVLALH